MCDSVNRLLHEARNWFWSGGRCIQNVITCRQLHGKTCWHLNRHLCRCKIISHPYMLEGMYLWFALKENVYYEKKRCMEFTQFLYQNKLRLFHFLQELFEVSTCVFTNITAIRDILRTSSTATFYSIQHSHKL